MSNQNNRTQITPPIGAAAAATSQRPSLKARAIAFLSRREHSRKELARKLAPHAPDVHALDALLDELANQGFQSDERFAHSLINRRANKQGMQRIVQELREHGVDDAIIESTKDLLRSTEHRRASAVWEKKFGNRPEDARDYARQYRFMMGRGFSSDCVRRLLGDWLK